MCIYLGLLLIFLFQDMPLHKIMSYTWYYGDVIVFVVGLSGSDVAVLSSMFLLASEWDFRMASTLVDYNNKNSAVRYLSFDGFKWFNKLDPEPTESYTFDHSCIWQFSTHNQNISDCNSFYFLPLVSTNMMMNMGRFYDITKNSPWCVGLFLGNIKYICTFWHISSFCEITKLFFGVDNDSCIWSSQTHRWQWSGDTMCQVISSPGINVGIFWHRS